MLSRNAARRVAQSTVTSLAVRRGAIRRAPAIRSLTDSAVEQPHLSANVSLRLLLVAVALTRGRAQEGWLFVDSVFPIRLGIWEYARPDRGAPSSLTAIPVSAIILVCFVKSPC
jgi:hypothetical protein